MLNGHHVKLRSWRDEDLTFFHELRNDVTAQLSLMSEPRPHTWAGAREWLEARTGERDQVFFVIESLSAAAPIGFIELRMIRPVHGHASLGIYVTPGARGKGFAAESLELLTRYGMQVVGLRKIVLQVFERHARAIRLYERAGFERVGIQRAHFYINGEFHDVLIMEKMLTTRPQDAVLPWMQ